MFTDPHTQTGSDDEVSQLSWETYPPRPRIWADREENGSGFITWHLRLPDGSSYAYDSHAEAAEALRVLTETNRAVAA
ncbi:MAG: hypothetical protein ACTHJM_15860 [Marmoricola sp.]